MGSLGWVRCYWCPRWVHDPYIIDCIGKPLCVRCYDRATDEGLGPYWPSASDRLAAVLRQKFDPAVAEQIAAFATHWAQP